MSSPEDTRTRQAFHLFKNRILIAYLPHVVRWEDIWPAPWQAFGPLTKTRRIMP